MLSLRAGHMDPTRTLAFTYGMYRGFNAPVTEEKGRISTYNPKLSNSQIVRGDVDLPSSDCLRILSL